MNASDPLPLPHVASGNRNWRVLLPGLLLAFPLARAAEPAGRFDNLLQNSPFGASAMTPNPGQTAPDAPEFRSLVVESGRRYFSIYVPASGRSVWAELNAPADDLLVSGYDAAAESITVRHQGKTLTLSLKRAVVATSQAVTTHAPTATPTAKDQTNAAPPSDMSERQKLVQEELRRRRSLRELAARKNG